MRIPSLEELPLGYRIALTVVIVLVILFALAAFGYFTGGWNEADAGPRPEPDLYAGVPQDQKLLELDRRALDEAYHTQVIFLFGVWLKGGEADDGKRFANGMRIARRAYALAAREIEQREQQSPK